MREVIEHGSRWLVLDVEGIAYDSLLGLPRNIKHDLPAQQEEAITEVIVIGLQEAGIAAELRHVIPPSPSGIARMIIPVLRLYLPLKDTSRDIYAAMINTIFAHAMGVPKQALGAVFVPQTVTIFIQRLKGLNEEELRIATALSVLNRQLGVPVTSAQLSSRLGRDVESDALRLAERGVLRYIDGGWVVDFLPLTIKCQRQWGSAAAKCSNRTARHRPYTTSKVL